MENEGNGKELEKSVKVSKDVSTSIVLRGLDDLAFLVEHTPAEFFVQKGNACYRSEDYHQAVTYFSQAIRLDPQNVEAQFMMGAMYHEGQGVPQDYAVALKWYRKAAEQGLAEGQFRLGLMYHHGEGIEHDYAEAVKWYRKAAEQGLAKAQYNLGVMYHNGDGIEADYDEALKWCRKSEQQGLAEAQYSLGVAYYFGQGVPQDYTEAAKWFLKAAEQGYAEANCYSCHDLPASESS